MPEDIHVTLWARVSDVLLAGSFSATTEIYDELTNIPGAIGGHINGNPDLIKLEVGDEAWDWKSYLGHVERLRKVHRNYISEYNANRKGTVGLNDVSIIAMGLATKLPVISMEKMLPNGSKCRRIPNICDMEKVEHLNFSEFLRREGIKL
jgi:hypothetical protein